MTESTARRGRRQGIRRGCNLEHGEWLRGDFDDKHEMNKRRDNMDRI
jgi:hypothetical protein